METIQLTKEDVRNFQDIVKARVEESKRVIASLQIVKKVDSEKGLAYSKEVVKNAKRFIKVFHEERLVFTRPIDDFKKSIIKIEESVTEPIEKEIERVSYQIDIYVSREEMMKKNGLYIPKKYWIVEMDNNGILNAVEFYLQNGGDPSKFDFLKEYLLNNNQPALQGVNYTVDENFAHDIFE